MAVWAVTSASKDHNAGTRDADTEKCSLENLGETQEGKQDVMF